MGVWTVSALVVLVASYGVVRGGLATWRTWQAMNALVDLVFALPLLG